MGELPLTSLSLAVVLALTTVGAVEAQTPAMPQIAPVPPSGRLPLGSASRHGTEYVDLDRFGYVEEEYYMVGLAPAITAAGEQLFDAPYVTRLLIRKPRDPGRFNGTVVMEPFSWMGERGAGWILSRDYLMRRGYAFVGYTLSVNRPANDPKTLDWDPEPRNLNLDFMRRYDYKRYAPLGSYYDSDRFRRGDGPISIRRSPWALPRNSPCCSSPTLNTGPHLGSTSSASTSIPGQSTGSSGSIISIRAVTSSGACPTGVP